MGYRRPPTAELDVSLEEPPPNWTAHHVWPYRWSQEYRPPLPKNRAQAYRTIFNAGPLEPHLERARNHWSEFTDEERRKWWEHDDVRPGRECAPCLHHDGQAVALCPQECPSVVRMQAEYDAENAHYWQPGAQ